MENLYSLQNILFGELDKSYCDLFFYLMVFMFVSVLIGLTGIVSYIISSKKISFVMLGIMIVELLMVTIGYLQQRLVYSMCVKVL